MKIPLGIKILAICFLLFSVFYMLSLVALIPTIETAEKTPGKIGFIVGSSLRIVFAIVINLFAGIGLLRLKKWSLIFASISFIFEGIAFAISFGIGFAKGAGTESAVVKTGATLIGFLVAGTIATLLIIYIKKRLNKS